MEVIKLEEKKKKIKTSKTNKDDKKTNNKVKTSKSKSIKNNAVSKKTKNEKNSTKNSSIKKVNTKSKKSNKTIKIATIKNGKLVKTNVEKDNIFKKFIKKDKNRVICSLVIEALYIFIVEMIVKILLRSFAINFTVLRIALSSIIISLILTLITSNIKRIIRNIIYIIINFVIVFYAWLQIGFMNFLGAFMSMGNAEQGTKITDYIMDFLKAYNFRVHLIYIPLILYILYIILEKKFTNGGFDKKIEYNKKLVIKIASSLILLCGVYYLTIILPFMQSKFQTIPNKALFKYPSNPSITIKNYGSSMYFLLDAKGTAFGQKEDYTTIENTSKKKKNSNRIIDDSKWKKLDDKETDSNKKVLNNYFMNREIVGTNGYTGKFKGKNMIMIMMESLSEAVFDDKYKEYFPTLNKLYNEGITGVNNYSPKNNCATGESEMTSQISLYSIETTCTVNTYRKNVYPEALLSMLKNNGYYTSTYHDYTDHYYYRSTFEYNFGTQNYYGVTDLGMSYSPLYKEWPSDEIMMQKAIPKFIDKDKFASYMITVTTHTPYGYSSTYGDMYMSLFDDLDVDDAVKRYLSKIKVLDNGLSYMLKELKKQGKLDNTVIVLFGDHFPYALSHDEFQSIANYDISLNQETDRTPFIIYNSKTKGEKITKITTPMDYTPTLLNLFGIEYDPRYYLGHDIFSDYEDYAVFPDNSWQSSKGYYSASKGEFIPKDDKVKISDEEIININKEVTNLRNMSTLAIKNNYFNYLFNGINEINEDEKESSKESE